MANRWGIPKEIEVLVINRDTSCVYCGIQFSDLDRNRRTRRSWEHIINDIRLNQADNIALCCGSCNASKGSKILKDWLNGKYCATKNVNEETVSEVVKRHIEKKLPYYLNSHQQ
ncbi:MAG: hypothetical protein ACR2IL_06375 [Chitinophagaceae bacterium]